MMSILSILSAVVTLYSMICLVSIIMTWFPGAKFTTVGRFISKLADPFMNLFRNIRWLRVGYVDFSPIIGLGILSLISSVLGGITATGTIRFGYTLATIIIMVWNLCRSLISFLLIIMLVRFIVICIKGGFYSENSMWYALDSFLGGLVSKIARPIYKKGDYKGELLVSLILIFVFMLLGTYFIGILATLCRSIPF